MARMYENGSQIGQSAIVNSTTARGVFDANSAAHHRQNVQWPQYVAPFLRTYEDTLSVNTPITWTPFGERSSLSNVSVNSRVSNFLFTTAANQASHRLYLGYKLNNLSPSSVNTFYHDMTYVGVQIVLGTGPSIWNQWVGTSFTSWGTTTTNIFNNLTVSPVNFTYTNIAIGTTANRFNLDISGTGSAHTGILNGSNGGSGAWNVATSGTSNFLAQTSGAYYTYVETSGANNEQTYWIRSPFFSLNGNQLYSIRVAHYLNTSNTYSTDNQAFGDVCGIMIQR